MDVVSLSTIDDHFHPWLLVADGQAVSTAVAGWVAAGMTARVVRGRKMRTVAGVLDEFAAALHFPCYFGENKDAFDECIAELETLPPGEGYVITITEPDQVLADAGVEELEWLTESLESAADAWRRPIERGEWWDRPAVSFHVVLAGEREAVDSTARRWSEVGRAPIHHLG